MIETQTSTADALNNLDNQQSANSVNADSANDNVSVDKKARQNKSSIDKRAALIKQLEELDRKEKEKKQKAIEKQRKLVISYLEKNGLLDVHLDKWKAQSETIKNLFASQSNSNSV